MRNFVTAVLGVLLFGWLITTESRPATAEETRVQVDGSWYAWVPSGHIYPSRVVRENQVVETRKTCAGAGTGLWRTVTCTRTRLTGTAQGISVTPVQNVRTSFKLDFVMFLFAGGVMAAAMLLAALEKEKTPVVAVTKGTRGPESASHFAIMLSVFVQFFTIVAAIPNPSSDEITRPFSDHVPSLIALCGMFLSIALTFLVALGGTHWWKRLFGLQVAYITLALVAAVIVYQG